MMQAGADVLVHVAERSLFINVSRVLWGFSLRKKVDADGNTVDMAEKIIPGFFSVPPSP